MSLGSGLKAMLLTRITNAVINSPGWRYRRSAGITRRKNWPPCVRLSWPVEILSGTKDLCFEPGWHMKGRSIVVSQLTSSNNGCSHASGPDIDLGCQGSVDWARIRDLKQPPLLFGRQLATELNVSIDAIQQSLLCVAVAAILGILSRVVQ